MGKAAAKAGAKPMTKGTYRDIGRPVGIETQSCIELAQHSCHRCNERGAKDRHLRCPRIGPLQGPHKASNKSGQEGSVRQTRHGEGKACQEDREGLSSSSLEEEHLSASCVICVQNLHSTDHCPWGLQRNDLPYMWDAMNT